MDSGFYAACSGLIAKTRQLEAAAHNLANVGTTAFKGQQLSFRSMVAANQAGLSPLNESINEYGVVSSPTLNLAGGTIERSGNKLDLALEGSGYIAVQIGKAVAYTRNGHLQLTKAGQLVNSEGDAILGDQGPISVPPGMQMDVSPDGTISAKGALVGKLRLVDFAEDAKLNEISPGNFLSDSAPIAATKVAVRQGALEASNVDGVGAAVELIAIQRHAEMLERAMTLFHSEFNRIAASELSRV